MRYEELKTMLANFEEHRGELKAFDERYVKIYEEVSELLEKTFEELEAEGIKKGGDALLIAKVLEKAFGDFTLEQLLTVSAMVMRYVDGVKAEAEARVAEAFEAGLELGQAYVIALQQIGRSGQ